MITRSCALLVTFAVATFVVMFACSVAVLRSARECEMTLFTAEDPCIPSGRATGVSRTAAEWAIIDDDRYHLVERASNSSIAVTSGTDPSDGRTRGPSEQSCEYDSRRNRPKSYPQIKHQIAVWAGRLEIRIAI